LSQLWQPNLEFQLFERLVRYPEIARIAGVQLRAAFLGAAAIVRGQPHGAAQGHKPAKIA